MTALDDYQTALLAVFPESSPEHLSQAAQAGGPQFVSFVVDHGLGPLWHARTGLEAFRQSRLGAEALFAAQEAALANIGDTLDNAGVNHVVFKGAANRLFLYPEPAVRACYDLDLLVRPEDRVRAAAALVDAGFDAMREQSGISRALLLSRDHVDVDLHWGLLREGRLRNNPAADMLARRRRVDGVWMLSPEDALFVLLVHPAFAKHLSGWGMGLHRVADVLLWMQTQPVDGQNVIDRLRENGVRTAAWATLRWTQMLAGARTPDGVAEFVNGVRPGAVRRAWIESWLKKDLSARVSGVHWLRLLLFTSLMHDTAGDTLRAVLGRLRAHRRRHVDLEAFQNYS